jgi:hypothetical protein
MWHILCHAILRNLVHVGTGEVVFGELRFLHYHALACSNFARRVNVIAAHLNGSFDSAIMGQTLRLMIVPLE